MIPTDYQTIVPNASSIPICMLLITGIDRIHEIMNCGNMVRESWNVILSQPFNCSKWRRNLKSCQCRIDSRGKHTFNFLAYCNERPHLVHDGVIHFTPIIRPHSTLAENITPYCTNKLPAYFIIIIISIVSSFRVLAKRQRDRDRFEYFCSKSQYQGKETVLLDWLCDASSRNTLELMSDMARVIPQKS